jgi:hypothetical protein
MLGIRLGILKFSELVIFILNQEINYPIQSPPAQTFGKGHLVRGGPFYLSMFMLFTDIKLVGFFSNIPLNWPLAKKSDALPCRLYHQVAIQVLAGLTAAHRHVVAQY